MTDSGPRRRTSEAGAADADDGPPRSRLRDVLKGLTLGVYHGVAEPLRALRLKRTRLAPWDLAPDDPLPTLLVDPYRNAGCGPNCKFDPSVREEVIDRYLVRSGDLSGAPAPLKRSRVTPMAIELDRYADMAAFEALIRKRSSRTLPKARKALKGYVIKPFPMRRHIEDIHGVKTSMRVRTGGPVLDYWLLKPEHLGHQAIRPIRLKKPKCARHWTIWWGAFEPAPGHAQGGVQVDERLVAFIKAVAIGDVVHYADIMGHRDHLEAGVMVAIHLEIVRWLIERRDAPARGVRAVLYGAAEHGREGLLTWKRRAGFEPTRLALAAGSGPTAPAPRNV